MVLWLIYGIFVAVRALILSNAVTLVLGAGNYRAQDPVSRPADKERQGRLMAVTGAPSTVISGFNRGTRQ